MCDANKVASPGDVVASHIIKRLVNTFKEVHKDTLDYDHSSTYIVHE